MWTAHCKVNGRGYNTRLDRARKARWRHRQPISRRQIADDVCCGSLAAFRKAGRVRSGWSAVLRISSVRFATALKLMERARRDVQGAAGMQESGYDQVKRQCIVSRAAAVMRKYLMQPSYLPVRYLFASAARSHRLDPVHHLVDDRRRLLVLHREVGVPRNVDAVEHEHTVLKRNKLSR